MTKQHNEEYERLATIFYEKTGHLAPGKNYGVAANPTITVDERMCLWIEFLKEQVTE